MFVLKEGGQQHGKVQCYLRVSQKWQSLGANFRMAVQIHNLRIALLASTALIAIAVPRYAFGACLGENTGNVLCDAAHPATAGTLTTTFGGATTVNVNAGAAINNGGASATVTSAGDLVFNHNDLAGIASISARNDFGAINVTANAAILNGGLTALDNNAASTSAITVIANQSITGGLSVQNLGSGNTTATIQAVTGTVNVSGRGSNSSLLANGDVNGGDLANGGSVLSASFAGSGNANVTVNGAVSGSTSSTTWNTLIGSNVALSSSSANSQLTFNSNGAVTLNAFKLAASPIDVTGVGTAVTGSASAVLTIDSAISVKARVSIGATLAIGVDHSQSFSTDSAGVTLVTNGLINVDTNGGIPTFTATAVGINLAGTGLTGNLDATSNGPITVTDNGAVSGNVTGIKAGFSANTLSSGALAITNNGNISILSGGLATGISASTAGLGSISITNSGSMQVFSEFAAVGINGSIAGNTANASTLSIRVQDNINAQGSTNAQAIAESFGILARHDGTGDIDIDVLAPVVSSGTGISVTRGGSGNAFITIAGSAGVQGVNGLVTSGGSTVVADSGTIVGTGGTAIQFGGANNTLTLSPGAAITGNILGTGSDRLQLGGTGAATFDVSKIGVSTQYQGFNTFNKIGTSIWTLTGTNTIAQPWDVQAGTLVVTGSLTNSPFSVANGTLTGTGIVGATQVNPTGIFAPGNGTPGLSMTVASLAFTSGAFYLVQINPATASFATVTGAATLGDATVNAVFANGGYVSKQYTILSAGSISGTFNSMAANTNLPSGFSTSLSYDATHVFLNLTLNFPTPTSPNFGNVLSSNQNAVGNALINFFNSTGSIPTVFGTLTPSGLTQVSGETATGSQQTTFDAMSQFMGLLTDPFVTGRAEVGSAGGAATGYTDEDGLAYAQKRKPNDALAAIYTKAPPLVPFEQRWSVWAADFGGSQTTDGNAVVGSNTTTSRIVGSAVGADYRFSPFTTAGFALAGGGTSFSIANLLGSGRSDLFQAGAFIRHNVGAAYFAGALAYGWQDTTTNRTVTIAGFDQLRAEFNANAWSGRLEGGYRFVSPMTFGIGITPYTAAQFVSFDLPAYAERTIVGTNNFALAYAARDVTDIRTELGIRSDKSFAMTDGILTLRGRVAWAHDYDPGRSIAAAFQSLPGASFIVNGAAQAADSTLATASIEMKWRNGWSAAATFEGGFSNVTASFAGKGLARYSW
jgi:uncharacterized protein with beta-barrel porin domain